MATCVIIYLQSFAILHSEEKLLDRQPLCHVITKVEIQELQL